MKIGGFSIIALLMVLQAGAQPFANSSFETGTTTGCACPTGYTCANDAGRVVTGFHPVYAPGNNGCVTGVTNYANVLGAHTGTAAVYFYAGADRVTTPTASLTAGTKICLCAWYAGPQGSGASGQNTANSHWKFGVNGSAVSPNNLVPVNTAWTQYCYLYTVPSTGSYSFNILSGGAAQYAIWFDDFDVTICTALPIELMQFRGQLQGEHAVLQWSTATETHSDRIVVERSEDGANFEEAGELPAASNSTSLRNYTFMDPIAIDKHAYYRLKLIDLNGDITYSEIILLETMHVFRLQVFPNPTSGRFTLETDEDLTDGIFVMYDNCGREVFRVPILSGENQLQVDDLPAGLYHYTILNDDQAVHQSILAIE